MVVDTSAIYAVLADEPEREQFSLALASANKAWVSAATLSECVAVLLGKRMEKDPVEVIDGFVAVYRLNVVPLDDEQWRLGAEALKRFGKGRHPAKLNFGDSFSYALAKSLNAPLLFKGDDFAHTDIRPAL